MGGGRYSSTHPRHHHDTDCSTAQRVNTVTLRRAILHLRCHDFAVRLLSLVPLFEKRTLLTGRLSLELEKRDRRTFNAEDTHLENYHISHRFRVESTSFNARLQESNSHSGIQRAWLLHLRCPSAPHNLTLHFSYHLFEKLTSPGSRWSSENAP